MATHKVVSLELKRGMKPSGGGVPTISPPPLALEYGGENGELASEDASDLQVLVGLD